MERALAREDVLLPMIELAYAADDDSEMMHGVFELLRKACRSAAVSSCR
jgi:hypothetical protein